jgi:DNA polymerase-4
LPLATAHTETILTTTRELLTAAMPLIERQGLTLVGIAVANLDDDDTADTSAESGPLGRLLDLEVRSDTVESAASTRESGTPSQPSTASIEYGAGTTEHDDDREG